MRTSLPRRIAALVLAGAGLTASIAPTDATAQFRLPTRFPVEMELTKPLGFRVGPGLSAAPVLANRNYLQPPTRVKVVAVQGSFGSAGAFCAVEYLGNKGYIRCDDTSALKLAPASAPAPPPSAVPSAPSTPSASSGPFCSSKETCRKFCVDNCTFDPKQWGPATCRFPASLLTSAGDPPRSALAPLPALTYVKAEPGVLASAAVIDSFRKADAYIQSHPGALPPGHVVMVDNCYRSTEKNSTRVCGFVLKGNHLQNKWKDRTPQNAAEEATERRELADAEDYLEPKETKGLSWPGPGQHTRGNACDVKIAKVSGPEHDPDYDDMTVCRADTKDPKNRDLSRRLDEIMTNPTVGAVRLNYEMWHFEFGLTGAAAKNCRCVAPDCADKHWPPMCKGPSGC